MPPEVGGYALMDRPVEHGRPMEPKREKLPEAQKIRGGAAIISYSSYARAFALAYMYVDPLLEDRWRPDNVAVYDIGDRASQVKTAAEKEILRRAKLGEFVLKPENRKGYFADQRAQLDEAQLQKFNADLKEALINLTSLYKESGEDKMRDFGQQLGLLTRQQSANLSTDVQTRFGELVRQITETMRDDDLGRKQALENYERLIRDQIDFNQSILRPKKDSDGLPNWDSLPESVKAYFEQRYEAKERERAVGVATRLVTDRIRGSEFNRVGEAPAGSLPADETIRNVNMRMQRLRAACDRYVNCDDPVERESIKNEIINIEKDIEFMLVPFADPYKDADWVFRPEGKLEVQGDGWAEAIHLINANRRQPTPTAPIPGAPATPPGPPATLPVDWAPGVVEPASGAEKMTHDDGVPIVNHERYKLGEAYYTAVVPVATWDKASWYAEVLKIGIRSTIFLCWNAIQRLTYDPASYPSLKMPKMTGKDEFMKDLLATDKDRSKHPVVKSAESELKDLEKEHARLLAEKERVEKNKEEADTAVTSETERVKKAGDDTGKVLEAMEKGFGGNKGGGGNRNDTAYAQAQAEERAARAALLEAQRAQRARQREIDELDTRISKIDTEMQKKKDLITPGADPIKKTAQDEAVKKYDQENGNDETAYHKFVYKLDQFLTPGGEHYGKDFYGVFDNKREIEWIAKLNGCRSFYSASAFRHEIAQLPVVTGTAKRSDGSVLELDHVLIDLNQLVEEQKMTLSPLVQGIVLDPKSQRYAEVRKAVNKPRKIVTFGGFVATPELGGGVAGPVNPANWEEYDRLKREEFAHNVVRFHQEIFDSLVLQQRMNFYVDERACTKWARVVSNYLLRLDLFPPDNDEGKTYIQLGNETESVDSIETQAYRMTNRPLTSATLNDEPYYNTPDRSNEISVLLINDKPDPVTGAIDLKMDFLYRGENLAKPTESNPNAPETLLKVFYDVIGRRLDLYEQHLKVGSQAISRAASDDKELILKRGAFIEAYGFYIRKLREKIDRHFEDPGIDTIEKLRWLRRFHDTTLNAVRFEIFDINGNPIPGALPKLEGAPDDETFEHWFNGTDNWGGKLGSQLKYERAAYAATERVPRSRTEIITRPDPRLPEPPPGEAPVMYTGTKLQYARMRYLHAAFHRIKKQVVCDMLGRNALGLFPENQHNTDRVLAEHQVKNFMNQVMTELLNGAELLYRARVAANQNVRNLESDRDFVDDNDNIHKRRLIGAISRSRFMRGVRRKRLIQSIREDTALHSDPRLIEPTAQTVADWSLHKEHSIMMWFLSSYLSEAIQTGNAAGRWRFDENDEYHGLLAGDERMNNEVAEHTGLIPDVTPQLNLSPIAEELIKELKKGAIKEGADTTDRFTKADRDARAHTADRMKGYDAYKFFEAMLNATLADSGFIDDEGRYHTQGNPEKTKLGEFLNKMLRYIERDLARSDRLYRMNRLQLTVMPALELINVHVSDPVPDIGRAIYIDAERDPTKPLPVEKRHDQAPRLVNYIPK